MSRTLKFQPITQYALEQYALVLQVIEKVYQTWGACTHIGRIRSTGELAFVFPMHKGMRFCAVVNPSERRYMEEHGDVDDGVDEWELEETDAQLEAGIPINHTLF